MKNIKKVVLTGIREVGKTTIINALLNKNLDIIEKVSPTKGCNRTLISTGDRSFSIWDFGGVLKYRLRFLQQHFRFFSSLDELIYLFDIQNESLLFESFNYFKNIIRILDIFYNHDIRYYILLHKADPEIINSFKIRKNEKIILTSIDRFAIPFNFKIFKTSIYYFNNHFLDNQFYKDEKLGIGCLIKELFTPKANSENKFFN